MTATSEAIASVETCDECGFDGSRWDRRDTVNTIRHLDDMADHAVRGLPADLLNERPAPQVWSVGEYVDHMRWVVALNRMGIQLAVEAPGTSIGRPTVPQPADQTVHELGETIAALRDEVEATRALLAGLDDASWSNAIVVGDDQLDVDWIARHIVHDLLHHLGDIASIRHSLGDVVEMSGTVAQINASAGGVPKAALEAATIDIGGIVGDLQGTRQHHGRPWQALCLYSADVIEALRAEGHPIVAGAVGENLTLAGIDWATLRSGLVLEVGGVRARLSLPAEPCKKINAAFEGESSQRIDHERHPGWARWYATVEAPGTVESGAAVVAASRVG